MCLLDTCGFPRLYAAASLKLLSLASMGGTIMRFSAALCRGLIEARRPGQRPAAPGGAVFRGFMPRPH